MNKIYQLFPVIIVVGFSRQKALMRVLESLNEASYPKEVKLIVSLDGGAFPGVISTAENFKFKHGSLEVINHAENLGLRNHILWCGDQTENYGSVIIVEDDVLLDPQFYKYAIEALNYYNSDTEVAGIALYSPAFNENAGLPFNPLETNSSVYAMAVPCSWGQAWSKSQWREFKRWYGSGETEKVDNCQVIPKITKSWPESSWKKYFAAFMAEQNLYFVYPYRSYSTNCSDGGGTHIERATSRYQVSLACAHRSTDKLSFESIHSSKMTRYDSYMEADSEVLASKLNLPEKSLVVDLYGVKPQNLINDRKYCLTIRQGRNPIKQFSLSYKPIELNVRSYNDGRLIQLFESHDVSLNRNESLSEIFTYWSSFPIWTKYLLKPFVSGWIKKIWFRCVWRK